MPKIARERQAGKELVLAAQTLDDLPGAIAAAVVDKQDGAPLAGFSDADEIFEAQAQLARAFLENGLLVVAGDYGGQPDRTVHDY